MENIMVTFCHVSLDGFAVVFSLTNSLTINSTIINHHLINHPPSLDHQPLLIVKVLHHQAMVHPHEFPMVPGWSGRDDAINPIASRPRPETMGFSWCNGLIMWRISGE